MVKESLRRSSLFGDPLAQFMAWFEQAEQAGIAHPYIMALATTGSDRMPTVRMVLLRGFDANGFRFFTNYNSQKARQLAENQNAALLFYWEQLERQVRIQVTVSKLSTQDSDRYFATRPLENQLAAWASNQSQPIEDRASLEERFQHSKQQFGEYVPRPPHWGGYLASPHSYEYWQGHPGRLHDRFRYSLQASGDWYIQRLAP
jgi:pyridoxamine 5'-phosphate oxidase